MIEAGDKVSDVVINLKQIQDVIKRRIHDYYKGMALTPPQGMLLMMVKKHGSLRITEISDKMGLSNSTVSGIVDRLEAQELIERKRSYNDRRVVNVTVTEGAKERVQCHENILVEIMTDALKTASKVDLETIATGIKLLSQLLQKDEQENNKCLNY